MVAYQNSVISYLVIPSGATSGERIVIDGINGVIDIYDSLGDLVAQIGNGIGLLIIGTNVTAMLGNAGGNPALVFWLNSSPNLLYGLQTDSVGDILLFSRQYNSSQTGHPIFDIFALDQNSIELGFQTVGGATSFEGPLLIMNDSNLLIYPNFTVSSSALAANVSSGVPWWSGGQSWVNVTFAGNWANAGAPNANVQCIFMPDGTVRMRGLAFNTSGTSGANVFQLPAGYFPNNQKTFMNRVNVPSTNCVSVLVITTAGVVTFGCTTPVVASSTISLEDVSWEKFF